MIVSSNNSYYNNFYIKPFESKYHGLNSFFDAQYINVDVNYLDNKMIYNFTIYIANNFNLPNDSLIMNIKSNYFDVDNIQIIKSNTLVDTNISNIQHDVISVYKTIVTIDLNNSNMLVENLNIPYEIIIDFDLNHESINNNKIDVNQNDFSNFINEIKLSNKSIKLFHQNIINVNKNNQFKIITNITNDTNNKYYLNGINIDFYLEDLSIATDKIYRLYLFSFDDYYQVNIDNLKLRVNYLINNLNKSMSINLPNAFLNVKNGQLLIDNYQTAYDSSKKEMIFQNGNNGINFPFDTLGSIDVNFQMKIKNRLINFNISNNFNYLYVKPKINFHVENISEELIEYEEIISEE